MVERASVIAQVIEWSAAPDWLIPGGAVGAGVWLFYRLFIRADRRERDVFDRAIDQRDHYRARAEEAERLLSDALVDLATYRRLYGPLDHERVYTERAHRHRRPRTDVEWTATVDADDEERRDE